MSYAIFTETEMKKYEEYRDLYRVHRKSLSAILSNRSLDCFRLFDLPSRSQAKPLFGYKKECLFLFA
jgi:hypothetical protein